MIYFSKEPIKTWQPNLIMLDLEDSLGHIYVSRNTYDQAVLLSDRFNHDAELVAQKLGCSQFQEDIASYMVAVLPHPINILSPFYNLIDKDVRLNEEDMKQVVGVLSYMSMNLDFNMMLKVPYEVRANLVFTKSILLDYLGHFEDFNFRIAQDDGHIVHEKEGTNVPRSEREDFVLEDAPAEEPFDLDSFLDGIGWNDVVIPSISAPSDPAPEGNSTSQSVTPTDSSGTTSNGTQSDEDAYSAIIAKFS